MQDSSVTLVIGGARSGKSRYAQHRAESHDGALLYLATAQAFDDEMAERIARHRADRGPRWRTIDCPIDLPDAIRRNATGRHVLLVDCLTLWATNLLLGGADIDLATDDLIAALAASPCAVILVTNEVGMGIVPDNPLARQFRDIAGRLNQRVAAIAPSVVAMVAGIAMTVK